MPGSISGWQFRYRSAMPSWDFPHWETEEDYYSETMPLYSKHILNPFPPLHQLQTAMVKCHRPQILESTLSKGKQNPGGQNGSENTDILGTIGHCVVLHEATTCHCHHQNLRRVQCTCKNGKCPALQTSGECLGRDDRINNWTVSLFLIF